MRRRWSWVFAIIMSLSVAALASLGNGVIVTIFADKNAREMYQWGVSSISDVPVYQIGSLDVHLKCKQLVDFFPLELEALVIEQLPTQAYTVSGPINTIRECVLTDENGVLQPLLPQSVGLGTEMEDAKRVTNDPKENYWEYEWYFDEASTAAKAVIDAGGIATVDGVPPKDWDGDGNFDEKPPSDKPPSEKL